MKAWSEYLTYLRSPVTPTKEPSIVRSVEELEAALRAAIPNGAALLLSGGVDSRILKALMPTARCYTAAFEWQRVETLDATPVPITWRDYLECHDDLVTRKGCALTGVEPAVHIMCRRAKADGFGAVVSGILADVHFGDIGGFLSAEDPVKNYLARHLDPRLVLRDAVDVMVPIGDRVKFSTTLAWGDGLAFDNAAEAAGVRHIAPYRGVRAKYPVAGKPMLRALHTRLVGPSSPRKNGFARPMNRWLAGYQPTRREFLPLPPLNATQLFYVWSLERWMSVS